MRWGGSDAGSVDKSAARALPAGSPVRRTLTVAYGDWKTAAPPHAAARRRRSAHVSCHRRCCPRSSPKTSGCRTSSATTRKGCCFARKKSSTDCPESSASPACGVRSSSAHIRDGGAGAGLAWHTGRGSGRGHRGSRCARHAGRRPLRAERRWSNRVRDRLSRSRLLVSGWLEDFPQPDARSPKCIACSGAAVERSSISDRCISPRTAVTPIGRFRCRSVICSSTSRRSARGLAPPD